MKAILEFTLPDEEHEWELCLRAKEMNAALEEIYREIRHPLKYEDITLERAVELLEMTKAKCANLIFD